MRHHNLRQQVIVNIGLSPNPRYGDVSDLDPKQWAWDQMHWVSLGRGCSPRHGDISDLDPSHNNLQKMMFVSYLRSSQPQEQ